MDNKEEDNQSNEPQAKYNLRINITTLADLEEQDRELTRNMTPDQRMEYLNKLIHITFSEDDILALETKFKEGRIKINRAE